MLSSCVIVIFCPCIVALVKLTQLKVWVLVMFVLLSEITLLWLLMMSPPCVSVFFLR